MIQRPQQLNLSNWRQSPHSRWSFHHVREVLPTEAIPAGAKTRALECVSSDMESVSFTSPGGESWNLEHLLEATDTDAFLVAHRGKLVHEWYADKDIATQPHIVFSMSKSITATLAGVLVGQGLLDPAAMLTQYIPELAGSAYGDCSLQQLLDMTVSIDFDEVYTAQDGKFVEYRIATGWHPGTLEQIDLGMHEFLKSLQRGKGKHGEVFEYKSPNSDLLGWVLERVTNERLASLYSKYLWQPMGAEGDAYITVDRKGAARSAGGLCARPRDLLRFAEIMRNQGRVGDQQVVPASWVEECINGGDHEVWARATDVEKFEHGSYRNKWYQSGNANRAFLAIGIHGQWIYIDQVAEVVVLKLSSQSDPLNDDISQLTLAAFEAISAALE